MQLLRNLFLIFVLAGFFIAPAMAQTASEPTSEIKIDKKKLLVQPRNADGSLHHGVLLGRPRAVGARATAGILWLHVRRPRADQNRQCLAPPPGP